MKRKIRKIIILTLLFYPFITYSQVRWGIKGSVHRSNISEIHKESEGRIAGSLGGFAQIPIARDNQFFLHPEVTYSLQGEKDTRDNLGAKYFQNYINVSMMLRAYFSEADSEFFGELGPQVGFLVYQKNKDMDIQEYGDKPKSMDISIGAGIGYSILRRYEFSVRYNYGLVDVYKNYPKQERTSILSTTFAYIFD